MLFGCGESAKSCNVGGISSRLGIELFPNSPKILWFVVDDRKHPAQEKELACL